MLTSSVLTNARILLSMSFLSEDELIFLEQYLSFGAKMFAEYCDTPIDICRRNMDVIRCKIRKYSFYAFDDNKVRNAINAINAKGVFSGMDVKDFAVIANVSQEVAAAYYIYTNYIAQHNRQYRVYLDIRKEEVC